MILSNWRLLLVGAGVCAVLLLAVSPHVPTPDVPLSRLAMLVQSDDVCQLYSSRMLESAPPATLTALVFSPGSQVRARPEDVQVVETLAWMSRQQFSTRPRVANWMTEFYRALNLAGLLNRGPAQDVHEAIRVLESLKVHDPHNAAFPFFLAAARARVGGESLAIRKELIDAFSGSYFDSGFLFLARRIVDRGLSRASLFLAANQLVAALPLPDYGPSYSLFKKYLLENDPSFNEGALSLAQMLAGSDAVHAGLTEGVFWLALEREIARYTCAAVWKREGRSDPMPSWCLNSRSAEQRPRGAEWERAMAAVEGGEPPVCNRERLDYLVKEEQEILKNWYHSRVR